MRDNYAVQAQQAQALLLQEDLEALCHRHRLRDCGDAFFVPFCGEIYTVMKQDAEIFRPNGEKAEFSEVLSICDLLTRWDGLAQPCGEWATVYSLPHTVQSATARGPADVQAPSKLTSAALRHICASWGVEVTTRADCSFQLPIFGPVEVLAQLWEADEEFPAKFQLLWDKNVQAFLRYETIFYVAGHLAHRYGLE